MTDLLPFLGLFPIIELIEKLSKNRLHVSMCHDGRFLRRH